APRPGGGGGGRRGGARPGGGAAGGRGGPPAPAVVARPGEADVAGVVQPALPVAQEGELLGERRVVVRDALAACRPVGGEPRAQRGAEARVVGRVGEVHGAVYHPPHARCYIGRRCGSGWSRRSAPGIQRTTRPGPSTPD